jgi:hypothetical protein
MLVILTTAVQAFLITPYFIAVHRLTHPRRGDDKLSVYAGRATIPAFFGWLLVFFALTFVAFLLPLTFANIDGIPTPSRPSSSSSPWS